MYPEGDNPEGLCRRVEEDCRVTDTVLRGWEIVMPGEVKCGLGVLPGMSSVGAPAAAHVDMLLQIIQPVVAAVIDCDQSAFVRGGYARDAEMFRAVFPVIFNTIAGPVHFLSGPVKFHGNRPAAQGHFRYAAGKLAVKGSVLFQLNAHPQVVDAFVQGVWSREPYFSPGFKSSLNLAYQP